ncbi:MAG: hypothetical protein AAFY84_12760 [Pseudomonadota bacterium]
MLNSTHEPEHASGETPTGRATQLAMMSEQAGIARSYDDTCKEIDEFESAAPEPPRGLAESVDADIREARSVADTAEQTIAAHLQKRFTAFEALRAKLEEDGIDRPPRKTDVLAIIAVTVPLICFEGAITGTMFVAEGHMGFEAYPIAMLFALVNVVFGLLIGYLPGRYATYRIDAPVQRPRDAWLRRSAWLGCGLGALALSALVLAAAMTRVLGTHDGIWSSFSLGAIFNDAIAFVVLLIGIAASIISVMKGMIGISDAPGITPLLKQATSELEDAVEEDAEKAQRAIEAIFERSEHRIGKAERPAKRTVKKRNAGAKRLLSVIRRHNDKILAAKDKVRHVALSEARKAARRRGGLEACTHLHAPELDLSSFDAFRIVGFDDPGAVQTHLADVFPVETHAKLVAGRDKALARIRAAHAHFKAAGPDLGSLG